MDPSDSVWTSLAAVRFGDTAVESAVEDQLLRPLLRALGWPDNCVHGKVPAAQRIGRKVKPGRKPEADLVVSEPTEGNVPPSRGHVVLEAKRPTEDLDEDARGQAESYSVSLRALIYVVCNGRRLQVWRTGWGPEDTVQILDAAVDELVSKRAELEQCLSPSAVHAYEDVQRPPAHREDYDLGDYADYCRARAGTQSATHREAEWTGPGGILATVTIEPLILPQAVAATNCVFLYAGLGRGKTTALQLMMRAAAQPARMTLLPILIAAEDVVTTVLEAALVTLKPHITGLTSVAGIRRLFSFIAPLLLVDDWDRAVSAQRRVVAELPMLLELGGAVVLSSSSERGRPAAAAHRLLLGAYSSRERDDVVRRRKTGTTGPQLESSLPPELQLLAREPIFLDLLLEALRAGPRGDWRPPPNLTAVMERLLESVTTRDTSLPTVEEIRCVAARLAAAQVFSVADVQRALGECGGAGDAAAFARKMTSMSLWRPTSTVGDHAFSNPAWRAYFQSCFAFAEGNDWRAWVRDAPADDLQLAAPYAAHLAATNACENEFFRELLQRDARLYIRSLGARADSVGAGADDVTQGLTVLHSLRSGYNDIVELFSPALRPYLEPWVHAEADEMSGRLCVDGKATGASLSFSFGLVTDEAKEVVFVEPVLDHRQPPRHSPSGGFSLHAVNLFLSGLRVDSGRLVATRNALAQVREVVDGKKTGPLVKWLAREKMAGLLRALSYSGHLVDDIGAWTIRELAEWMDDAERRDVSGWSAGRETVYRDELGSVISTMSRDGYDALPFAAMDIARPTTLLEAQVALRRLLDAVAETYKAACEAWFPSACKHFTYGCGPFRFVAYLETYGVTYWLEPVSDWGMPSEVVTVAAGAKPPPFEDALRDMQRKATELGRESFGTYHSSSSMLRDWQAPVSREVRDMLGHDLRLVDRWLASAT